jgi:hypothetical protein
MTEHPPGLDDPAYAAFAWGRFRRLLRWMLLSSAIVAILCVVGLTHFYGPMGWIATLATIGGVVGSIMMAAALMGLVFLSSGTGHDEAVDDRDLGG